MAADPGESALDDPAFGKNGEPMLLGAVDDLDGPGAGLGDRSGESAGVVAGVGKDAFDEGKEAARTTVEDQPRAVAILHVGGVDDDVQQEADRVDENMPLAARNLLARIKALRVDRGPPF
jgi:hypothetical protein